MVQIFDAKTPPISLSIYTKFVIVSCFVRVIGGWMKERGVRLTVAREETTTERHF